MRIGRVRSVMSSLIFTTHSPAAAGSLETPRHRVLIFLILLRAFVSPAQAGGKHSFSSTSAFTRAVCRVAVKRFVGAVVSDDLITAHAS